MTNDPKKEKNKVVKLKEENARLTKQVDTLTQENGFLQRELETKNYLCASYLDTINTINLQQADLKRARDELMQLKQQMRSHSHPPAQPKMTVIEKPTSSE